MGRCGFVIHPLGFSDLARILPCDWADKMGVPRENIESSVWRLLPIVPVGPISVTGAQGARAECFVWGVTMTPQQMATNHKDAVGFLKQIVRYTGRLHGAQILGLGAVTGIVGNRGQMLAKWARMGITTGNSLTAGLVPAMSDHLFQKLDRGYEDESAAVVGAAGSIGQVIAQLWAARGVRRLFLVGKSTHRSRLEKLEAIIRNEYLRTEVVITTTEAEDWTSSARLIATASSDPNAILDAAKLLSGTITIDAASPQDVDEASAVARPDLLVIDGARVKLPPGYRQDANVGLPSKGLVYGCLAETLVLTLEDCYVDFTIGETLALEKVEWILSRMERHGFTLASPLSFGKPVDDSRLEQFRQCVR